MGKHDEKLEQKSPAKTEISALDDHDLEKVTGGDELPKESIAFNFGNPIVQYTQQKPDGALLKNYVPQRTARG